jgi:hypothetical protein
LYILCRHTKIFGSQGFRFYVGLYKMVILKIYVWFMGRCVFWCLGERRVFIYIYIQHRGVKVVRVVSVNPIQFFQRATRIWILTRMAIYYKGVRPYIYTIYTDPLPAPLLGTIPRTHSHSHPRTCSP